MTPERQIRFIARWLDLTRQRAKFDFAQAKLAVEIRREFGAGARGDVSFRRWLVGHLGVAGSTAAMLVRAVKVHRIFPRAALWAQLGGWSGVHYLAQLERQGRKRVITACLARAEHNRRPLSYDTVKSISFALGVAPDRIYGRPNMTVSEEKLRHLRSWVTNLYEEFELPAMPRHVLAAMNSKPRARTKRSKKELVAV